MYSLGSVSAVGSWFCISVTSNVRKSFAEMVAESLSELLVVPVSWLVSWIMSRLLTGNVLFALCAVKIWFQIGFICAAIASCLPLASLFIPTHAAFPASRHDRDVALPRIHARGEHRQFGGRPF